MLCRGSSACCQTVCSVPHLTDFTSQPLPAPACAVPRPGAPTMRTCAARPAPRAQGEQHAGHARAH